MRQAIAHYGKKATTASLVRWDLHWKDGSRRNGKSRECVNHCPKIGRKGRNAFISIVQNERFCRIIRISGTVGETGIYLPIRMK